MRVTEKWREAILRGEVVRDVKKTVFPEISKAGESEAERKIAFVISSAEEDRDGDTIDPAGWDLEAYRKNPVVLWAHEAKQLPVARSPQIGVVKGKLRSIAEFPERGVYPFADTVYDYLKGGFLRGASVGFNPTEAEPRGEGKGIAFHKQELYEYSVLPIPSHREALAEAKAAGLDVGPIIDWAERVLAEAEESGVWVPRYSMEKAIRLVVPVHISVPAAPSKGATLTGGHAAAGAGSETKTIREEGGEFCVYDSTGTKKLGCHATMEDAQAQLAAIDANKAAEPAPSSTKQLETVPAAPAPIYGPNGTELAGVASVGDLVEAYEEAQDESEDRWVLFDAFRTSIESIRRFEPDAARQRELLEQAASDFAARYKAAKSRSDVDALARALFDLADQEGDGDGTPPGDEGDPNAPEPKQTPPDDEPPKPDDEPDPGDLAELFPDEGKQGEFEAFGVQAVDEAMAALHDVIAQALATEDLDQRAAALKAGLEAFAAVVMQQGAQAPAEPPANEPPPSNEPPPQNEGADDGEVAAALAALLGDEEPPDEEGDAMKGLTVDEVRDIVRGATKAALEEDRRERTGRLPD